MGFLAGKRLLITGLLSNRSIAYGIARACRREGAELAFSYVGERFRDRITEFAAEFDPIANGRPLPTPINETRELGFMLYDVEHHPSVPHVCDDRCRPAFFPARLAAGTLPVPTPDSAEVRR